MQMDIQCQGFTLTPGLGEYVKNRLAYAISHAGPAIRRVAVRLGDINGPRGGADKRCLIELRLKAALTVVVEDVETDLYRAIDRAADRAGRTLDRRLARLRRFGPTVTPTVE
ncbi:MAG: HPF/RaiA family ribosome-associated protein [Pseudomonadota bacterium]